MLTKSIYFFPVYLGKTVADTNNHSHIQSNKHETIIMNNSMTCSIFV